MRKIFANLKSVVALAVVAAMTLSVSCMYDDTALTKRVNKVEKDLAALTERVNALENNESINDLLNGAAVITDVTVEETTGNTIITLSNGKTVTVLAKGLQYKVVDGVLQISADGETWVAVTAAPDAVVESAVVNEDGTVTITLANGTEFTVAKAELIECKANRSQVYVRPGESKAVRFTINDAVEDINVMNQPFGWSASVEEYVEVEEDDFGGGGFMPLAVGGKEYVLNITGPAKKLVAEGLAAAEGVVSVHFNTAAGACKVMNVAVNIAEITLTVDKDTFTLTNSIVTTQSNPMTGMVVTDFADFCIGYMTKAEWEEFGVEAAPSNYTYRNSGFSNVLQPLSYFEEGVCEVEEYTFTAEQFLKMSYDWEFEVGGEYVIFVTPDYDVNYEPDLSSAVVVDYKRLLMSAVVDESSITAFDAAVTYSLSGYNYFLVCCAPVADIEEMIAEGFVADYAGFYEYFLAPMWGPGVNMQAGAAIPSVIDTKLTFAQLNGASMTGPNIELKANTEYHLFVFPFNESDMMDPSFAAKGSDVYGFGTFTTAPLTVGTFDPAPEYTINEFNEELINVDVDFSEDVVKAAYAWFDSSAVDPVSRAQSIINEEFMYTFDQYTPGLYEAYAGAYNFDAEVLPNPIYMGIIAVNAAGEYVYIEKEFTFVFTYDYEVEFASAEFVDGVLKLQGTDAGDYANIIVNPGLSSLVAGEYIPNSDQDYSAAYPYPILWTSPDALEVDASNSTFNMAACPSPNNNYYFAEGPNMTVAVEGDIYTIVIDAKVYIDGNKNVKLSFTGKLGAQQPEEPEQPAGAVEIVSAVATHAASNYIGGTGYDLTFTGANGEVISYRVQTKDHTYLREGEWNPDYNWSQEGFIDSAAWTGVGQAWPYYMQVAVVDGNYDITLTVNDYKNANKEHVAHFVGQIEGFTLPVEEEVVVLPEFVIPGEGEEYDLDYRYTAIASGLDDNNALDVIQDNGWKWQIRFNTGLSEIVPGDYTAVGAFTTADALEVNTYDGGIQIGQDAYFYADDYDNVTTLNIQKEGDFYCITMIGTGGFGCPVEGKWRLVYIGKLK